MRKNLIFTFAVCASAIVLGAVMAYAAGETTGTNVSCATATLPAHTIGVDGTGVDTIAGTSTTNCHTATYTIPTNTVTTTVTGSGSATSTTTSSTSSSSGVGSCPVNPPGSTWTVGGHDYNLEGWDTFTKNQAAGAAWNPGTTAPNTPVYTGDHGMQWTEYPDGWAANGVTYAYQPSTVQSVHDGVLDFNLHDSANGPVGASPSPLPGGNRNQTYGAWSFCEKIAPDAGSDLADFKQAILLWPQNDSNGGAAESDFPEGNFTDASGAPASGIGAFAHYGSYPTQDSFPTGTLDLSQWHVYTQTWGPGFRSYYVDGRLIGTSTSSVWSQPERWQLQVQPLASHDDAGHGHVYVSWVWAGTPASTQTTSSSSTTSTTSSTTPTTTTSSTTSSQTSAGAIQHVVVIVMENQGTGILSQMPYLNSLANTYGKATSYYAIGHYSADNYIAMTSGTTCCFDDSLQNLDATPSIFSQLGSQAQTLAERGGGGYAQRHDPGAYYGFTSQGYMSGQSTDLTGKKFTLLVPGLCDDMHDCGASTGDAWLQSNVPKLQANPGTAIFITFDESSGGSQGATLPPSNGVPMVVVTPSSGAGVDATQFTHYSLLRTVEDLFGLPCLGSACQAASMVGHLGLPAGS